MMNEREVEELFAREVAIFGVRDGITLRDARNFLCMDALMQISSICTPRTEYDIFDIDGECATLVLYLPGFKRIAGFQNLMEITGITPGLKRKETKRTPEEKLIQFPKKSSTKTKKAAAEG